MNNSFQNIQARNIFLSRHILVWSIIYLVFASIHFFLNGFSYNAGFLDLTYAIIVIISIFYLTFFVFYFFWGASRVKLITSLILLYCFLVFLGYLLEINEYNRLQSATTTAINKADFLALRITPLSIYILFVMSTAVTYFFLWHMKKRSAATKLKELASAQNQLTLESQNLVLQKELLQTENNFLRAQINPHFLYNCLNYFYAETFKTNKNVADGILKLSELMRYSINDFSGGGGYASLTEEVENIQNLIDLNRMRFPDEIYINFNVDGAVEHKLIAPLILVTLVENIFKHVSFTKEQPANILCTINDATNRLSFTTENFIGSQYNEKSGLGLENLKKRLSIIYADNYTFRCNGQKVGFF